MISVHGPFKHCGSPQSCTHCALCIAPHGHPLQKGIQAEHRQVSTGLEPGLVPESFFSLPTVENESTAFQVQCVSSMNTLRYSHRSIHSLPHTVWNRNYRVQPSDMMLRNLNFSKLFFQDKIWMEIKHYRGVFLCMPISLELNIQLYRMLQRADLLLFLRTRMLEER